MCPCGHERTWHTGPGRSCQYGHDHVMGGCTCLAYRSRRYRDGEPPPVAPLPAAASAVAIDIEGAYATLAKMIDHALAAFRTTVGLEHRVGPMGTPFSRPAPVATAPTVPVAFTRARPTSRTTEGAPALRKGARKLLDTLARHHPMRVSRAQLATLAGFTVTGGTFQTYLSDMRRGDFVRERDGLFECTPGGLEEAGVAPGNPMTPAEVVEQWRRALRAGARAMLDVVLARREVTRDQLAAAVEMTASGGTFQTYLSDLRRNGLVEVSGATITVGEALRRAA